MLRAALEWLGLIPDRGLGASAIGGHHRHGPGHGHGAGHSHGVVDPAIATTARGIWAVTWSFAILMITTALQAVVYALSGSVALLADTIHNFGDAATAIPLWIAFLFARRQPSRRFTYGFHRVEDLAGGVIVGVILFSAVYAGYESIGRLVQPQPVAAVWAVAAAGAVGFAGNEIVAVLRIRVGRQIASAALIADGYHARVDGFTSLAVVAGALGVWLGFPLADPIVGMLITVAIFAIVWQSARAVFTRMLDGVEPEVIDAIAHAARHVPGIVRVERIRARWLGHRLHAEADIAVDADLAVREAERVAAEFEQAVRGHLPALAAVQLRLRAA